MDATHVIAHVAVPNTLELLRQARRHVVRAVEKREGRLQEDLRRRFYTEEPLHREPTAEVLREEVRLSEALLAEAQGHRMGIGREMEVLERVLHPEAGDKVVSVVDPDARFGHKSLRKTFVGYKVHMAEDSSELVTSLEVLGGNVHEGHHLPELLAQEEAKGVFQTALAADGLYDSAINRRLIDAAGMVGYIPVSKRRRKSRGFRYNPDRDRLACPAGEFSIGQVRQGTETLYTFSPRQCLPCEDRAACPSLNGGRVRVYLSDDLRASWAMPPDSKAVVEQERKRIEREFGEAKQWHRLDRARYWGKAKVAIQALLTFLVINAKRMVKLLQRREALSSPGTA